MSERVLPLRGISVFEAAARTTSFQAAARELNLTPSAVSHQIRLLEEVLGVRLFDRVGRGVALTPDGAEYARSVRQSIRRLRLATSEIKTRGSKGRASDAVVRIEAPPSFAHCWLLPHLPELMAQHPGIDIRLNAQGPHLQGDRLPWPALADAPADLQIVYGGDDLWQDRASLLFSEVFKPFCAPALLRDSPDRLLEQTLIGTSQNYVSWEDWFNGQGIDLDETPVATLQLDPSHLAIAAAVAGMGVMLENEALVERELSAGSIVSPFPQLGLPGLSYWIFAPSQGRARSAVDDVAGWIRQRAAA